MQVCGCALTSVIGDGYSKLWSASLEKPAPVNGLSKNLSLHATCILMLHLSILRSQAGALQPK